MKKTFVLDTNVLLHDPNAVFAFADNHILIPIYVIEEVDTFKKDLSELGRNAREIARVLDGLRIDGVQMTQGIELRTGGTLQVAITERDLPSGFKSRNSTDNKLQATALEAQEKLKSSNIDSKVISVPCYDLFINQSQNYRDEILGKDSIKISIEASSQSGWKSVVGKDGVIFGLSTYGKSAPYKDIYKLFNLTSDEIVKAVKIKVAK